MSLNLAYGAGGVVAFGLIVAGLSTAAAQDIRLAPDQPTQIAGGEAVCTGVGEDEEHNPRWRAYPLKVVVTGRGGQFMAGERVTLSQRGADLLSVTCDGPWVLFKVPAGQYRVTAALQGETTSLPALVRVHGQREIILRFGDLGAPTP